MQDSRARTISAALKHLSLHDPVIAELIARYGGYTVTPHTDYYHELIESIIGQQLSVKAAAAIKQKFVALFGGQTLPTPQAILEKSHEDLRSAGLSNAKARYIQDLALHVLEDRLDFKKLDNLSNNEVIEELTAVKGIGEWTAHMFMIFCMGRLDILPVGDLGIKNGIMKLYNLPKLPGTEDIKTIAQKNSWHPYESVASWYVWKSLDNAPAV